MYIVLNIISQSYLLIENNRDHAFLYLAEAILYLENLLFIKNHLHEGISTSIALVQTLLVSFQSIDLLVLEPLYIS